MGMDAMQKLVVYMEGKKESGRDDGQISKKVPDGT
jgi:hypothetical protein